MNARGHVTLKAVHGRKRIDCMDITKELSKESEFKCETKTIGISMKSV